VQQRVAGADNADGADDDDEVFVLGTTAEAYGEDSDGYWWWQSTRRHEQQSGWCHSGRCWQQVEWVGTGV
jgi:hypothetical protein